MSEVKPFRCVRPSKEMAAKVASLPYDVYSREESAEFVKDKPYTFLNIDRPETGFDPSHDMYAEEVYDYAKKTYEDWKKAGIFLQEEAPCYYVYELTMDGRTQTGITGAVAVKDYETGVCKKHENTVAEKEADRIHHVDTMSAQTGPIFLAYRRTEELSKLVEEIKKTEPLFDFVTLEGIGQRVWLVDDPETVQKIEEGFKHVPCTYIADGHHRAASAVKVSQRRRSAGKANEDSEQFLAVLFPDEELKILDYNRIVKDLNGLTKEEFLKKIEAETPFTVTEVSDEDVAEAGKEKKECRCPAESDPEKTMRPFEKGQIGMYLDGKLYRLTVKDEYRKMIENDPVKCLDVSVLQDTLLSPILGIGDPRTDKRIKFVGGIRGLKPLMTEVDALTKDGNLAVSFAMYPTSMAELFAVADAGLLMPPKSTWFEPKLRSGLFIHEI